MHIKYVKISTYYMAQTVKSYNTPTGMFDLNEKDIHIRNYIFNKTIAILKLRGAQQIETPVAELYSTVESLYGEEFNKLVYTFDDENQKIILRYDLTVPLARYVGSHGLIKFKRFQYGKVYRKDTPQIQKGRLREFYQFDYDIIGDDLQSGINDMEMLETLITIMLELLGDNTFCIKLNYKDIVIKMLTICNISEHLFKTVFSAIDKLDKKPWSGVAIELQEKGLDSDQIKLLETFYNDFTKQSTFDLKYKYLIEKSLLSDELITQIQQIGYFLNKIDALKYIILDPFLIRGMDYYTGILFEVTYNNKTILESTIAAGGRYDNMIAKFSNHSYIPAIGMSLGIERIVKILEQTTFNQLNTIVTPTIYIASVGDNMYIHRMILCHEIRQLGYYTVTSDLPNPKMRSQFSSVFEDYPNVIPIMIIIGENEIKSNIVTIKDVKNKIQHCVQRNEIVKFLENLTSNCT